MDRWPRRVNLTTLKLQVAVPLKLSAADKNHISLIIISAKLESASMLIGDQVEMGATEGEGGHLVSGCLSWTTRPTDVNRRSTQSLGHMATAN